MVVGISDRWSKYWRYLLAFFILLIEEAFCTFSFSIFYTHTWVIIWQWNENKNILFQYLPDLLAISIYDCYGATIATFIHILYPICFVSYFSASLLDKYQHLVQLYSALRYSFQHCTEMHRGVFVFVFVCIEIPKAPSLAPTSCSTCLHCNSNSSSCSSEIHDVVYFT